MNEAENKCYEFELFGNHGQCHECQPKRGWLID